VYAVAHLTETLPYPGTLVCCPRKEA